MARSYSSLDSLPGLILRGGLSALGRRRLAQTDGTLKVSGSAGSIEIIRDRWGVPHVYATTEADALFALGFVHAQDRLWQMEINRRLARGRLSEMLGAIALDTDRVARTFGFDRIGRADRELLPQADLDLLNAYVAGVNAFVDSPAGRRSRPLEFTLLRHTMEPWRLEDTLAFSRVMVWQMSHAWYGELIRAQLIDAIGPERAAELEIMDSPGDPCVLPEGIEINRLAEGTLLGVGGAAASDPFLKRRMGSNSWAISPGRSATGRAILCNDMHLQFTVPNIWYEVHLEGRDLRVTGVSVPGLPAVIAGHNDRIAFGATLAYTDCEDLFVEKFDPANPQRYEFAGDWLEAEIIPEEIRVKGRADPHVERVTLTRHGPVISDVITGVIGEKAQRLAVNSMALRSFPLLSAWLKLDRAGNWEEFTEAMRGIEAPQLNFSYADVDGNIGYRVTGKVPVRAQGQGMAPAPGWTGEHEWIGEVPFEEMPHALNPAQGYVVHSNNKIVADDYPCFLGRTWMNGYRTARLVQMLEAEPSVTVADCRAMMLDVTCLPGLEFVEIIREVFGDAQTPMHPNDPEANDLPAALNLLRAWDGRLSIDSVGGTLYEVTRAALVHALFAPVLGPELTERWQGKAFHPIWMVVHEFYGHDTATLLRLLRSPESWWVVQAGGRQAVLERSLVEAVGWLRSKFGPNPAGWQWGRLHRLTFGHALGAQKPLDLVFNRGPLSIGGDTDTPLQTASLPGGSSLGETSFANDAWSPSMRLIIDLGDLPASLSIVPIGQSGQLGSRHYDDLMEPWSKGEFHPMLWTREQVEEQAEARLSLTPGEGYSTSQISSSQ